MEIKEVMLQPSGWVPNNQRFPVLIYRRAISEAAPSDFAAAFAKNDWTNIWFNGVFDYQHYHSGAHEVLGIGCGTATLQIGGPGGMALRVSTGDCIVLPAGTGHKNCESSPDFTVVGAYPKGQTADIQTTAPTGTMIHKILSLPVPDTDPICGSTGGVVVSWR
jgi:uncharacterized protein YjlB